jgi:hypothetical protein
MHRVQLLAVLAALVATAAVAGCGGSSSKDSTDASSDRSWSSPANLEKDAVGTKGLHVCALLPVDRVEGVVKVDGLRAQPNDSLDLATCRYAADHVNVRILVDGASQAVRRYFDQQAEAQQKFNTIPSMKPRDVHGVGDDKTFGSAGAFWTRARHQLVAIEDGRIARVTVNVPGRSEQTLKGEAGDLARDLFAAIHDHG